MDSAVYVGQGLPPAPAPMSAPPPVVAPPPNQDPSQQASSGRRQPNLGAIANTGVVPDRIVDNPEVLPPDNVSMPAGAIRPEEYDKFAATLNQLKDQGC